MSNPAVYLLREQLRNAHGYLEGTLADVSADEAHCQPGGLANPIAAQYAHVVTSEDGLMNGMFQGGAPLFAADFAERTGLSAPPPASNSGIANWHEWANSVQVDMAALHAYAQAVYAASDTYLATLSDADLARVIPSSLGDLTLAQFISAAIIANYNMHCGEIAMLKGISGKQGYPF